jgi:hypothetical protein
MSKGSQKHAESNFVEVIDKIQTLALTIMKKRELSFEQMAQSTAIATAFIIQQSGNIAPEEGFGIAIYHYIEGSKTNPPDFNSITKYETKKQESNSGDLQIKPWWKIW